MKMLPVICLFLFGLLVVGANSQCTNNSVRLVWGDGNWEGNVQVCVNGVWGWVCDNNFGEPDAQVVCNQLGFNTNGALYRTWSYYGWGNISTPIHWDRINCVGNESSLSACSRTNTGTGVNCGYNEIAGVVCPSGGTCTGNSIRKLRNNNWTPSRMYGRVEMCYNGQWGRVCDDSWGSSDARVACFELGYSRTQTWTYTRSNFGQGYGQYVYDDVACSGNENTLVSCSSRSLGSHNCAGSEDAGVGCFGQISSSCTNGQVRLWRPNGGVGPEYFGLGLYCKNSRWTGVCDDSWRCHNTRLFCQQLGYPGAMAIRNEAYWGYFYSTLGNGGVDHYAWSCSSSHTSLSQCSYYYHSSCNAYHDQQGIVCYPNLQGTECTEGDIKLVDGLSSSNGRIAYCFEGYWAPLCSLSINTATAICKTLGFTSPYVTIYNDQRYGRSHARSGLNYINCPAGSSNVSSNCTNIRRSHSGGCYLSVGKCSTEYGLGCYNPGTCQDGSIRLVDGVIQQEGRIEVCSNGVWGTICSNGWNPIDGYVVCTQLGYTGASPVSYYNAKYGSGTGPPIFLNILCDAWDTSLSDCSKTIFPNSFCYPQYVMGIVCKEGCTNNQVRLVGGGFENEGTVQICYNNLWGLVSDKQWDNNDARVVCNQLGYTGGNALAVLGSQYGKPNMTVHLTNVSCTGNEMKIDFCTKTRLSLSAGSNALSSSHAAGVDCIYDTPTDPPCVMRPASYNTTGTQCTTGEVRLQGGQDTSSGRLEYCYNGYWSPFCKMNAMVAQVACRELGYTSYTWGAIAEFGEFGTSMNYSLFDNFTCTGSEPRVSQCTMNVNAACTPYCRSSNLGLRCYNPGVCSTEGAVRLVDGIIENEGRVEVCVNGVWGSVCDQGWDKTDAHVVCQQLGHPELEPYVFYNSTFGDGQYPIVYTNTDCGGWENELTSCTKQMYPSDCSRGNVAGLLCGYDCNDGDVRLVGGNSPNEGTIEICFDNLWGLVASSGWTTTEVGIVCEQLGYEKDGSMLSSFTKPDLTIHFTDFSCTGNEDQITACSYTSLSLQEGKRLLSSTNVAGVTCNTCTVTAPSMGAECSTEGNVRLTGGQSGQNEGTLEYCFKNKWSKFCYLGADEAIVACRQLGYGGNDVAAIFTDGRFDNTSTISLFTNFTCSVNSSSVLDECHLHDVCPSACDHPIGLKCYQTTSCAEGAVRLVGGDFDGEGRVEVCYKGVWGSVCGTDFDETDAHVACKGLGMDVSTAPTVYTNSRFGRGDDAVVLSNLKCKGYEASLLDCEKAEFGSFTCPSNFVVGIACQANCFDGQVRLVGSNNTSEGTVLACSENTWGVIADNGWDNNDAQVVCKQLNYSRGGEALLGSAYGKPNYIVLYNNMDCTGSEENINECNGEQLSADSGRALYSSVNFASVKCTEDPTTATADLLSASVPATASLVVLIIALVLLAITVVVTISAIVYLVVKRKRVSKARVIREPRVMVHGLAGMENPSASLYENVGEDEYNTADKDEILKYIDKN